MFYDWDNSIRFEIGNPALSYDDPDVMTQAFQRSIVLFNEVFEEEDDILFVTDIDTTVMDHFLQKKPLNIYRKYIKQKQALRKLRFCSKLEEDSMMTHRFVLNCKKVNIRYRQLLQAICYEDFVHSSTILKCNQESGYNIYLINTTKKIIYHLYDDRGCDIVGTNKEAIRFLYETYNDWILDYDRAEVDATFQ